MENSSQVNTRLKLPNKKITVVLGILLVVVLGTTAFLIFNKKSPTYEQANLVKTELYIDPKIEDLAKFVSELPYEEEGFMIEYYPNSGFYFITLRGQSDQEINNNKNKANDWIKSHNVFKDNDSFCGLKYQVVLPPKADDVEVMELEKQLTMPGCNSTDPEYIAPEAD